MVACLQAGQWKEEEVAFLFSCHGLPRRYIDQGDIYESECARSFEAISQLFPRAICRLSYQSKFGKGEWLRPYTDEMCKSPHDWCQGRRFVVIVPLSFTSDHIETLYEIEKLYLPLLEAEGVSAKRCPAINVAPDWIDALAQIAQSHSLNANEMLFKK
jgi:ferrochelatase